MENISFEAPKLTVALNATGDFYKPGENLKDLLELQIQSSVHLESEIRKFLELGADTFVEIGPGNTLTGFVKKTAKAMDKKVTTYTIDTAEDLKTVISKKEEIFS